MKAVWGFAPFRVSLRTDFLPGLHQPLAGGKCSKNVSQMSGPAGLPFHSHGAQGPGPSGLELCSSFRVSRPHGSPRARRDIHKYSGT